MPEIAGERGAREFRDRACQFDTRRAAANDDEGEEALHLIPVIALFGALESGQQPFADIKSVIERFEDL